MRIALIASGLVGILRLVEDRWGFRNTLMLDVMDPALPIMIDGMLLLARLDAPLGKSTGPRAGIDTMSTSSCALG